MDYPIVRTFTRKITHNNPYRVFPVAVVASHLDKDLLPYSMNQSQCSPNLELFVQKKKLMCGLQDCSVLCNVQSDFSAVELSRFKLKNRHFWNMGEKYYRVDYLIKVALGPVSFSQIPEVDSQFANLNT